MMQEAINEIRRLRTRSYRRKTGLTIVEGSPELARALKAKVPVRTLYHCPELFEEKNNEFADLNVVRVSKDEFAQMAFGKRLKGVLAIAQPKQYALSDLHLSEHPIIVILEAVEKPGNLGTVIRTCDGAGVDVIIMCDSLTDVYNHNVVRSSIGTVFHVPTVATTKEEALAFLRQNNLSIIVASSKAKTNYSDADFLKGCAIVMGNEHDGVSAFWYEHSDQGLSIPMYGEAECLNVSVSASIFVYEALRQRSLKRLNNNYLTNLKK